MLRGRRTLIVIGLLAVLAAGTVIGIRWVLRPDNVARLIGNWTERELGATLTLAEAPGVRLLPRLQVHLSGARVERDGVLAASAEELNLAMPWSVLWTGQTRVESLQLRRPVIAWPELMDLLANLSDDSGPARTPRLPRIEVGLRVEDGTLLSGDGDDDWRLDQLSLITTPMLDGEVFNLDAGARLRGRQSRALSFTLRTRPRNDATGIALEDTQLRWVVSPDGQPLSDGLGMELSGRLHLDAIGLNHVDLAGTLPAWPDWLPDPLGLDPNLPVSIAFRLDEGDNELRFELSQGSQHFQAELAADEANMALAQLGNPIAAIAAIRGEWRLQALEIGAARIEGIELDVRTLPPVAAPGDEPSTRDGDPRGD